jgi:hypothetical protein
MFWRLRNFRGTAARHDRLTVNFLTAVSVAATVTYWLGGRARTLVLRYLLKILTVECLLYSPIVALGQ